MALSISNNKYVFPSGYRSYVAVSTGAYVPWNGYNNGANAPNNTILGAVVQFAATGVPTDAQIMSISGPNGRTYKFQFLYNASVGTDPDAIIVRLPNSGSSTAAQVITALLAVLSAGSGSTEGGATVVFPWVGQSVNATTCRINFTANGAVTGTIAPANMAITTPDSPTPGQSGISTSRSVCASAGPAGAFLPGP